MTKLKLVTDSTTKASNSVDEQYIDYDDSNLPAFDERFGIRLGRKTYYINVRIGTEFRSKQRLTTEGQVQVSGIAFIYCVVCSAAIMLFGTLCLLYLIKSGMGINLTDGPSFLHPLFSAGGE